MGETEFAGFAVGRYFGNIELIKIRESSPTWPKKTALFEIEIT